MWYISSESMMQPPNTKEVVDNVSPVLHHNTKGKHFGKFYNYVYKSSHTNTYNKHSCENFEVLTVEKVMI